MALEPVLETAQVSNGVVNDGKVGGGVHVEMSMEMRGGHGLMGRCVAVVGWSRVE